MHGNTNKIPKRNEGEKGNKLECAYVVCLCREHTKGKIQRGIWCCEQNETK